MALGRRNDEDQADESGHYVVDLLRIYTPAKITSRLNERWAQGWRLTRMDDMTGSLYLVFERRD